MIEANVVEFKTHLSDYLKKVRDGEHIQIRNRNLAIALVSPVYHHPINRTRLGSGIDTVQIHTDLTEPAMDENSWEMLR